MTQQNHSRNLPAGTHRTGTARRGHKTLAALVCVLALAVYVILPIAHRIEVGAHKRGANGPLGCAASGCCVHDATSDASEPAPEQPKHDPRTCHICTALAATLSSGVPTPVLVKAPVPAEQPPAPCYELILPFAPLLASTAPRAPPSSTEATTLNPSDSPV